MAHDNNNLNNNNFLREYGKQSNDPSKNVHVLIPRTCEYVMSPTRGTLQVWLD